MALVSHGHVFMQFGSPVEVMFKEPLPVSLLDLSYSIVEPHQIRIVCIYDLDEFSDPNIKKLLGRSSIGS